MKVTVSKYTELAPKSAKSTQMMFSTQRSRGPMART